MNYLYKIVLNSAFGLSNDKHSFLKDPMLTMKITCNGQLLLVMLMEELCESIPGARPIMINTDGGELIFPEEYIPLYEEICERWEKLTDLILEFDDYEKLIIFDVNNYIGIFGGEQVSITKARDMYAKNFPKPLITQNEGITYHHPVKLKGRFEIDKALHKNKSYRIKPIAIYNYFVHGIEPEHTILNNTNIYDFCAGIRAKGKWKIVQKCIEDGDIFNFNTQKTVRYYRSPKGCKLIKKGQNVNKKTGETENKQIKIESDKILENVAITVDESKTFDEYNIVYDFYKRLIQKEIRNVEPLTTQESLFQ